MKKQRLYAPFVKDGKRWHRAGYSIPSNPIDGIDIVQKKVYAAYPKEKAVRIYQNWLLAPFLNGIDETRELRPIKDVKVQTLY